MAQLGDAGGIALGDALGTNGTFCRSWISQTPSCGASRSIAAIARGLEQNTTLQELGRDAAVLTQSREHIEALLARNLRLLAADQSCEEGKQKQKEDEEEDKEEE